MKKELLSSKKQSFKGVCADPEFERQLCQLIELSELNGYLKYWADRIQSQLRVMDRDLDNSYHR